MKVKVISLPYISQVLYVLCFTRSRYQVSVYRTNGPLVLQMCLTGMILIFEMFGCLLFCRADLTVDDIDRINESLNADHIKM